MKKPECGQRPVRARCCAVRVLGWADGAGPSTCLGCVRDSSHSIVDLTGHPVYVLMPCRNPRPVVVGEFEQPLKIDHRPRPLGLQQVFGGAEIAGEFGAVVGQVRHLAFDCGPLPVEVLNSDVAGAVAPAWSRAS